MVAVSYGSEIGVELTQEAKGSIQNYIAILISYDSIHLRGCPCCERAQIGPARAPPPERCRELGRHP